MGKIKKPLSLAAKGAETRVDGCLQNIPSKPACQSTTSFSESMAAHGLECPDTVIADGVLHRFHVEGDKPGTKNGWYVSYNDGVPAGAFGSWKLGQTFTWCAKEERTLTEAERAERRERIAKAKAARDQEQERLHAEAREKALQIWSKATPTDKHPYLEDKGVKSYGLRQHQDLLVVPLKGTTGVIHTLQFINADGVKRFLSGGAVRGNFFPIPKSADDSGEVVLVCEGYATASSLREATGRPVACALNCGNLKPVAEALRKKFPDTRFILCADDDFEAP